MTTHSLVQRAAHLHWPTLGPRLELGHGLANQRSRTARALRESAEGYKSSCTRMQASCDSRSLTERQRERCTYFLPASFYLIFCRLLSDRQSTFPKPAFRLRKVINRLLQTTLATVTNITQKKLRRNEVSVCSKRDHLLTRLPLFHQAENNELTFCLSQAHQTPTTDHYKELQKLQVKFDRWFKEEEEEEEGKKEEKKESQTSMQTITTTSLMTFGLCGATANTLFPYQPPRPQQRWNRRHSQLLTPCPPRTVWTSLHKPIFYRPSLVLCATTTTTTTTAVAAGALNVKSPYDFRFAVAVTLCAFAASLPRGGGEGGRLRGRGRWRIPFDAWATSCTWGGCPCTASSPSCCSRCCPGGGARGRCLGGSSQCPPGDEAARKTGGDCSGWGIQ